MKYRFHRAATAEHYDNVNFYEDRLPGLGADYLKEFESVMALICSAPSFYQTIGAPNIHKAGLKRFPFHVIIAPSKIKLSCLLSHTNAASQLIGRGV